MPHKMNTDELIKLEGQGPGLMGLNWLSQNAPSYAHAKDVGAAVGAALEHNVNIVLDRYGAREGLQYDNTVDGAAEFIAAVADNASPEAIQALAEAASERVHGSRLARMLPSS
jgi:predicted kinase